MAAQAFGRDFEAMRVELERELADLEQLVVVLACGFAGSGADLGARADHVLLSMSEGEYDRARSRAGVMKNRRRFFAESLEKLRSHGRCLSIPEKPWVYPEDDE